MDKTVSNALIPVICKLQLVNCKYKVGFSFVNFKNYLTFALQLPRWRNW